MKIKPTDEETRNHYVSFMEWLSVVNRPLHMQALFHRASKVELEAEMRTWGESISAKHKGVDKTEKV